MPDVGIARGAIEVNLAHLQAQRQVVVNNARQMGDAFTKSFQGNTSAVQSFDAQLKSLSGRLNAVRGELLAVSVSGTALTTLGLKAADNLRVLEARFVGITGSQEKGVALMQRLEQEARKFGQPVRETQTTLAGVVKQLEDAGENVEDFVGIAARLRLVDPTSKAFDVQVALREAISGNFLSLQRRFEFPPAKEIAALVKETGSLSAALDIILTDMGASAEVAEEMGHSFSAAATNLGSTAREALERAFTPALDEATGVLNTLNTILANTPDGLLAVGGGATIAVTGLATLTLTVGQLLNTYQNLQKAGFFTNFASVGKGIGKAGVLVGAGAVGVAGGFAATRTIGAATGNQDIENFSKSDALNVIKQAGFLAIKLILDAAGGIAKAIGQAIITFRTLPTSITNFRGQLEQAFGGLIVSIASVVERIENFVPGGDNRGSENIRSVGEGLQAVGQARQETTLDIAPLREGLNREVDARIQEMQRSIAESFNFIESEADATADATEQAAEETESAAQRFKNAVEQMETERVEAFLAGFDKRVSAEQEYLAILDQSPEQIAKRIESLNQERQAIEQYLPELEALAATNEDAAEKAAEYRSRLEAINTQTERFGPALENAAKDAIKALDSDFQSKVAQIESEREKAINAAFDDLDKAIGELGQEVSERQGELRQENLEALRDYQKAERDIVKDHRARVLEIEQRGREEIIDAAARLDAAGVFAARQRRTEARQEEDAKFNEERQKNRQRLQETQANLSQEAQELTQYYQQRHAELVTANQEEVAQLNQKYDEEVTTAQTAYNTERQALQQHLNNKLQMERTAQQQEAQLRQQGFSGLLQRARDFTTSMIEQANRLAQQAQLQQQAQQVGQSITNAFTPPTQTQAPAYIPSGAGGASAGFATGGRVSVSGSGSALAFVENKERVLTPQQNTSFERLVDVLAGGANNQGQGGIPNNLQIDVTGADSIDEMMRRAAMAVIGQVYKAQIQGRPS